MPINSTHRSYHPWYEKAHKNRLVAEGEEAVKFAGEKFLPRSKGLTKHEYEAYRDRGMFFGATKRTIFTLVGSIFRRDPILTIPDELDYLVKDVDLYNTHLFAFIKEATEEVITVGRHGVLVDWDNDARRAKACSYAGENIINWKVSKINGVEQLEWIVLCEHVDQYDDDPFEPVTVKQYRLLYLDNGVYTVQLYTPKGKKDYELSETIVPSIMGRTLDYIPFVITNTTRVGPTCEDAIINDLANVNLHHYRFSCDLAHGLHFTSLPTPWIAGLDVLPDVEQRRSEPMRIGSQSAWLLPQGAATGMLEFSGQGIGAISSHLAEAERKMAILGARILDKPMAMSETAEAASIRVQSESAALVNVVDSVDRAFTKILRWIAVWHNQDPNAIDIEINRDFINYKMNSLDVVNLISAWQSGAIDSEALFYNLQQGERLAPDVDKAAYIKMLDEKLIVPEPEEGEAEAEEPSRIPTGFNAEVEPTNG